MILYNFSIVPISSFFKNRFLILMSSGLYRSLEEATGTDYVNKDLVQMIVEQVRIMILNVQVLLGVTSPI